jgi:hypothetical protein
VKMNVVLRNIHIELDENGINIDTPSINVYLIDLKKAIMDEYKNDLKRTLNKYVGEVNNIETITKMKNEVKKIVTEKENEIKDYIKNYIFNNIEINIL